MTNGSLHRKASLRRENYQRTKRLGNNYVREETHMTHLLCRRQKYEKRNKGLL